MDDNMVTVEIQVDSELLQQVTEVLKPTGLTPEDAFLMFIEYLVNPKTQNQAIALLLKWRDEQDLLDQKGTT